MPTNSEKAEIGLGKGEFVRVFISSVIGGMEVFRNAVAEASETLGHVAVRAEDFRASPQSPRIACLEGVRNSDVLLLILGARYGAPQPSGLSATHEEYNEARETHRPVLAMVQEGVNRDSLQEAFVQEVQDWMDGQYTSSFATQKELHAAVIMALHQLELQSANVPLDSDEMLQRAFAQLPQHGQLLFYRKIRHGGRQHKKGYYLQRYPPQGSQLALVLACGPLQSVLRPAQLESSDLSNRLQEIALHGPTAIFTPREGTDAEVEDDTLVLIQESRFVRLTEYGSISYAAILPPPEFGLSAIVEEDVREEIDRFIRFTNEVLSHIDNSNRLSHCVIAALLLNADYSDWRTRSTHAQNPHPMTVPRMMAPPMQPVTLAPPTRIRAELRSQRTQLAEDMTIQLRREFYSTG